MPGRVTDGPVVFHTRGAGMAGISEYYNGMFATYRRRVGE